MVSDDDKKYIESALISEADRLAYFYGRQYRNWVMRQWGRIGIFTRGVAMGTMTWGDVWHLFWYNIKSIIFGPWVLGSFLIFLQWLLVGAYITPQVQNPYFIIMPGLLGGLVFMLNIEASRQPMDWLTHFISGVMIGFSTVIVMVGIMTPEDLSAWGSAGNWFIFWAIWAACALFIGVFQFYQTGGFLFIFQISVIALLFGYVALGPYVEVYRATLDQIKPPLVIAYRAVSGAVTDVWYLATNPTEYYARQQLKNVRPEKPMDYPKGLEITSLDALPDTVHMSTETDPQKFDITVIITNNGESPARNIDINLECECSRCNCIVPEEKPDIKGELKAGELKARLSAIAKFNDIEPTLKESDYGREAEYRRAKAIVTVSYEYSTNSSLKVEIANEKEIYNRQLKYGGDIFKPEQAVVKVTPAQVSMNVGPQPLYASKEKNSLIVSILNQRDDGDVILTKDSEIRIHLPATIGSDLNCQGKISEGELTTIKIDHDITISANDFKSIYSFKCSFTTANAEISKSDFITAELIDYTFKPKKEKAVILLAPLGIIPTEEEREKEGEGEAPSVTEGSALYVKIDPPSSEVYAFTLTDDSKLESDEVKFALDDFVYKDGKETTCVVLAVNEESWGKEDKSSVWYIKPSAVIKKSSERLWDDVESYIVDWGCTRRVISDCDFCIRLVACSAGESFEKSGPDPSKSEETIGGAQYTTEPNDACKSESDCELLEQDKNGNHYWKPKYELLCGDDGKWHVCTKSEKVNAGGYSYECKDNAWVQGVVAPQMFTKAMHIKMDIKPKQLFEFHFTDDEKHEKLDSCEEWDKASATECILLLHEEDNLGTDDCTLVSVGSGSTISSEKTLGVGLQYSDCKPASGDDPCDILNQAWGGYEDLCKDCDERLLVKEGDSFMWKPKVEIKCDKGNWYIMP